MKFETIIKAQQVGVAYNEDEWYRIIATGYANDQNTPEEQLMVVIKEDSSLPNFVDTVVLPRPEVEKKFNIDLSKLIL